MPVYQHLFGPVLSRRLGISLGVDLIPYKTCSLDCVYCECGATTELTLERKVYVATDKVLAELKHFFSTQPKLDYITFSGAGEPTLASNLGEVVTFLKENYPQYKIAVLTNGTLLAVPAVRAALADCDLVKISIDAVRPEAFAAINRPQAQLSLENFKTGIRKFCQKYSGQIWAEIFVLPGFNDTREDILALREFLQSIRTNKIQLNTLDRPGAIAGLVAAAPEKLQEIATLLQPLPVEIISRPPQDAVAGLDFSEQTEEKIISLLQRRPCTAADLAKITGLKNSVLTEVIKKLQLQKKILTKQEARGEFYLPVAGK